MSRRSTPWTPPEYRRGESIRAAAPLDSWRSAAREITARHGLNPGDPQMAASGSDVVLRCADCFIKITAPYWTDEIEAEASALRRFENRLPVATARVLGQGSVGAGADAQHTPWPYVVMSVVDGTAIGNVWPTLDNAARRRLAERLGLVVAAVHALPPSPTDAAPWPEFFERARAGAVARETRLGLEPAWLERIEPFLLDVEPLTPGPPVWLHTELLDEHILVEERDGEWVPCGIVDFADGRAGHRGYEFPALAEFIFRGEPGVLRAFMLAYGFDASALDHDTSRELMAWSLIHQFGSVRRLLDAVGAPKPNSFDELAARLFGLD